MLKFGLWLTLLLIAVPATAEHQTLICADCRDVQEHPTDFGNYAFNTLIEPLDDDFSIFTTYSTSTYVWNRQQQWALVLLEDVIENVGISVTWAGINIPVQISSPFTRITVQDQYGKTISYDVVETSSPLVVGDGTVTQPPPPPPPPPPAPDPAPVSSAADLQDVNFTQYATGSSTGGFGTMCCQTGEFYWYYDMPEFRIQTYPE